MKIVTQQVIFISDYITYDGNNNYTIYMDAYPKMGVHIHLWMDTREEPAWASYGDDDYELVTEDHLEVIRAHMKKIA